MKKNPTAMGMKQNVEIVKKAVTQDRFPNLFEALNIATTILIGSIDYKKSFSTIRRMKNYLRM